MDLNQHNGRLQTSGQLGANNPGTANSQPPAHTPKKSKGSLLSLKSGIMIVLIGIVIIFVALLTYITVGHFANEANYVNKSEYQAVFININGSSGGQAYFGNIVAINSKYIVLNNAFYLQSGSTSNQFTLNNLTCALYNPQDQMVINRDQVAFWQNLKSTSAVTVDINKWNTDKLQCSKSSSTSSNTTGAPSSSTNTTTPSSTSTGSTSTTGSTTTH